MTRANGAPAIGLAIAMLALPVAAQSWRITPAVSVTESYSDNLALQPDPLARSGWVTHIIPSLRLEHLGANVRVLVDYRRQQAYFVGNSDLNDSQNYLNAFVNVAAVQNWLYFEARALIDQQNRSAFGPAVVVGAPNNNRNRVETRSVSASPYVTGRLFDTAQYHVRFNESEVRTDAAELSRLRTSELVAKARSASASAKLGWSVDARSLTTRPDGSQARDDNRVRAALIYAVDPQLHVSVLEGYEETDFAGDSRQRGSTPGAGIEWSPGPRTQLAGVVERRFFGTGYLATFRHRTPRTAWRISAGKDATVLSGTLGAAADRLEDVMGDLLASSIPDPVQRAAAARLRLADASNGPTTIGIGFLTQRPFLNRTIDANVAFIGPRSTVTATVLWREQKALAGAAPGFGLDSFATSAEIRQRLAAAQWIHRLTPLTSITLAGSSLRTEGREAFGRASREDLGTIFFTSRMGPGSTASFGYRAVRFDDNASGSYRENAVFGTLTFRL